MGKKVKKCNKQCRQHAFLLKPVHYSAAISRELSASFCPPSLSAPSITPAFNSDKHPFTSAFILPADHLLKDQEDSMASMYDEAEKREEEMHRLAKCHQKSKLLIAKPRSKSRYCSVCKDEYDDYLEHIEGDSHKSELRENKFNDYIQELAQQVGKAAREEQLESLSLRYTETLLPSLSQESTCFDEKPHLECIPEYHRISSFFHTTKNFHFIKEQGESTPDQHEPSLFHHQEIHFAPILSPVKSVLSVIISGAPNASPNTS